MMTLRETCKACGETHVTKAVGITSNNYAVVVDRCNFCAARQAELDAADEYAARRIER